ncbi:MAG: hypothetical protein HY736_24365 [Verrucomicrobia bacterium]|nr:hypothetical protein [Verrucomicrobiota bacterium]
MHYIRSLAVVLIYTSAASRFFAADEVPFSPTRVSVPGKLRLHLREQKETLPQSGRFEAHTRVADWSVSETAIIICDMWEDHPCKMAAHRVDVMAPEMNRVVSTARSLGVQIIHAPSGGMRHYDATPQRQRLAAAPAVKPPVPIEKWCYHPLTPPYVSHERGTELAVEHVEKYWCPSILSSDLRSVVAGSADPASKTAAK